MKAWIKAHISKKDVAPVVQPEEYGKSFKKWWTVLQPSWRQSVVDGKLTKEAPDDEKWEGLMKGGTAGIYIVVVALSWWIKALGTITDGGDASEAVQDVTWVLDKVCGSLLSNERGSPGLKRDYDDLSEGPEGTRNKKRWVYSLLFRFEL
jgi:hypothetical protein